MRGLLSCQRVLRAVEGNRTDTFNPRPPTGRERLLFEAQAAVERYQSITGTHARSSRP